MSTTLATSDALAGLEVPKRFDVTKFPRDVEASVERTVNPFHRAILKNYFRHLLLEISGYWDQILVPELTIDEPVYPTRAPRKNDRAHRPRRGGKLLPHHLRNGQERHRCTADVHARRRLRGCHGSPVGRGSHRYSRPQRARRHRSRPQRPL